MSDPVSLSEMDAVTLRAAWKIGQKHHWTLGGYHDGEWLDLRKFASLLSTDPVSGTTTLDALRKLRQRTDKALPASPVNYNLKIVAVLDYAIRLAEAAEEARVVLQRGGHNSIHNASLIIRDAKDAEIEGLK